MITMAHSVNKLNDISVNFMIKLREYLMVRKMLENIFFRYIFAAVKSSLHLYHMYVLLTLGGAKPRSKKQTDKQTKQNAPDRT